jgi:hypothetical protein
LDTFLLFSWYFPFVFQLAMFLMTYLHAYQCFPCLCHWDIWKIFFTSVTVFYSFSISF